MSQPEGQYPLIKYTRRYLDPEKPGFVDDILPTRSIKLKIGRGGIRQGTSQGSYRLTGSYRESTAITSPGTYSLLITRISAFSGSLRHGFFLRHSRLGTIEVVRFESPGDFKALGNIHNPIIAVGVGTLFWGFTAGGTTQFQGSHLEGYVF